MQGRELAMLKHLLICEQRNNGGESIASHTIRILWTNRRLFVNLGLQEWARIGLEVCCSGGRLRVYEHSAGRDTKSQETGNAIVAYSRRRISGSSRWARDSLNRCVYAGCAM